MSSGAVIARAVRDLHAHEQAARLLASITIVFSIVPIAAPLAGRDREPGGLARDLLVPCCSGSAARSRDARDAAGDRAERANVGEPGRHSAHLRPDPPRAALHPPFRPHPVRVPGYCRLGVEPRPSCWCGASACPPRATASVRRGDARPDHRRLGLEPAGRAPRHSASGALRRSFDARRRRERRFAGVAWRRPLGGGAAVLSLPGRHGAYRAERHGGRASPFPGSAGAAASLMEPQRLRSARS